MAAKMETLESLVKSTNSFTPGPWTVEKHEKSTVSMGGQCVIVAPAPDGASYGEQVANAALISAAPELLEALRDLRGWANIVETHPQYGRLAKKVNAAIAKAQGVA